MKTIKGVDLSVYQRGISYKALSDAGVQFAIIRAGFSNTEDKALREHIAGCRKYGIKIGFYWYSYAYCENDALLEAESCIEALKNEKSDFPVYFDMEELAQIERLTTKERTDIAVAFCEKIRQSGYDAGIYANPSWMEHYYDRKRFDDIYDIWLAHWTGSADHPSEFQYGQSIWQWGLDSIGGMRIDGDVAFIKDEKEKPDTDIKRGDRVRVKTGSLFSGGIKPLPFVFSTTFSVINFSKDKKEALIGIDGRLTGWIGTDCLEKAESSDTCIAVGDRVKVRSGASDYYGNSLADFVYSSEYEVMQVGTSFDNDYIVIGQGGIVTAGMKKEDIFKI